MSDDPIPVLASHIQAFLDSAALVLRGYDAAVADDVSFDRTHHRQLAMAAEGCPAFKQLSRYIAQTIPRYRSAPDDVVAIGRASLRSRNPEVQADRETATFLRRVGAYRSLVSHAPLDAQDLAHKFLADTARHEVRVRHLVPIDGLCLTEGVSIDFGAGRLISLDIAAWNEFFETDLYAAPDTAALSNVGVLEIFKEDQERHGDLMVSFSAPASRVAHIAEPWITYLCLYSPKAVRPCALYSKQETLLTDRAVETVHLMEPSAEPRYGDPEQVEPDYVPKYELTVDAPEKDKLRDFLMGMESGRHQADTKSARLSTALHWFRRTTEHSIRDDGQAFFLRREAYEDFLTDAFTALEAVLLTANDKPKGPKIAARIAALLGSDEAGVETIRAQVDRTYKLRNDIVHGDVRPSKHELISQADWLSLAIRQILVVALRLGGDLTPFIQAVSDPAVRSANRLLAPRFD